MYNYIYNNKFTKCLYMFTNTHLKSIVLYNDDYIIVSTFTITSSPLYTKKFSSKMIKKILD